MRAMFEQTRTWVAEKFGLVTAHDAVLDRRVPSTPWYYGDGMTLLTLFGVQVATGTLLSLTYSASPLTAYDSVLYITNEQTLGWFVRGLHYWSAGLMVVMLFYHVLRQILVGGYKLPREGTWMVGTVLFFLVLVMSLTGYMLRGDERALYAFRVVMNGMYEVPFIGEELVLIAQGGYAFGARAMSRIFGIHAIAIPALLGLGIGYHVYLIVIRGVTSPIERKVPVESEEAHDELYHGAAESEEEGETFWPYTVADGMRMGATVFGVGVVLAAIYGPGTLYPEWNHVNDAFPAEEWWFWWYSAMAALLPPAIAPAVYVLLPFVVFAAMIALPLLDRGPLRGMRNRPSAVVLVVLMVCVLLYLSDLRRRSPWTAWPVAAAPEPPPWVELTPTLEEGRQLFATYGCNSCHQVSGDGPRRFGPDLAEVDVPYSYEALRSIVLDPPDDWQMPSYRGHITEPHLELVVRYVLAAQTFPRGRE